jgi:hypothetical protein
MDLLTRFHGRHAEHADFTSEQIGGFESAWGKLTP